MEIVQKSIMGIGANLLYDTATSTVLEVIKTGLKLLASFVIAVIATTLLATLAAAIPVIGPLIAAGITNGVVVAGVGLMAFSFISSDVFPDKVVLPTYYVGPEEIFAGEILLLDPNIFNPKELYVEFDDGTEIKAEILKQAQKQPTGNEEILSKTVERYFYYKDGDTSNNDDSNKVTTSVNNAAYELKDIVAKWYYIIRNIALVGLMIVLLYVGIRIIMSSIAAEKSKYKQMLSDWVIAVCLIFLMQYIMVFANEFTAGIVRIFSTTVAENGYIDTFETDSKLGKEIKKQDEALYNSMLNPEGDDGYLYWKTNLIGDARIEAQQHDGSVTYVGYTLCYIVLVLYTVFFLFTYLKRLLYLLFLTIISPLVALTYPIDKIKDSQAQAFNMWLKEYIFNLIIQPFHLLLYVVFISMAFELSSTNIIYSLVVLGFLIPAEKFLRKMFGFDKASTPGFLAGPAGAALTISAVQSLAKFAGKGGKGAPNAANKLKEVAARGRDPGMTIQNLLNNMSSGGGSSGGGSSGGGSSGGGSSGGGSSGGGSSGGGSSGGGSSGGGSSGGSSSSGKKLMSGARARMSNYARKNLTFDGLKNKTITAAKTASKFGLGAVGLGMGAAGISTGSPGDVLKYGTAGAYAGSAVGEGAANRAEETGEKLAEKIENDKDETLRTQYSEEDYTKMKNEQKDKKFAKDKEKRELYNKGLNLGGDKKKIDQAMEEAKQYRQYGIEDDKLIIKAMNLDKSNRTKKESIAAAALANNITNTSDLNNVMKRFAATPGIDSTQVENMREMIIKLKGL